MEPRVIKISIFRPGSGAGTFDSPAAAHGVDPDFDLNPALSHNRSRPAMILSDSEIATETRSWPACVLRVRFVGGRILLALALAAAIGGA
jgi:hypothetical protein